MYSLHGCTGPIKCERSLPRRVFLRSQGAARVHGDTGTSHALRLLSTEVGLVGLLKSTTGRLRCEKARGVEEPLGVNPLGVGRAEDPLELGRVETQELALVDSEFGVFLPALALSSLSQPQLLLAVNDAGITLELTPRILLLIPMAGFLLALA